MSELLLPSTQHLVRAEPITEEHAAIVLPQQTFEVYKVLSYEDGLLKSYAYWLADEWLQIYEPSKLMLPRHPKAGFFAYLDKERAIRYSHIEIGERMQEGLCSQVYRATTTRIVKPPAEVLEACAAEHTEFLDHFWSGGKLRQKQTIPPPDESIMCMDLILHERVA